MTEKEFLKSLRKYKKFMLAKGHGNVFVAQIIYHIQDWYDLNFEEKK